MALFFFHFFDGESLSPDETGTDLANVELALLEVSKTALEMWPELLAERVNPLGCAFDIANAKGEVVVRFDFVELLNVGRSSQRQPSAPLEIMCSAIADTHRRANQARAELDASMVEARRALKESRTLLAQL
jgi:hypothetical protein